MQQCCTAKIAYIHALEYNKAATAFTCVLVPSMQQHAWLFKVLVRIRLELHAPPFSRSPVPHCRGPSLAQSKVDIVREAGFAVDGSACVCIT